MLCWFFLPVICLKFALLLYYKIFKLSRGSALKGKGTPFIGQGTQMGIKGMYLWKEGVLWRVRILLPLEDQGTPVECKGTP